MSDDVLDPAGKLQALRQAFDQVFAQPPQSGGELVESLLGIRLGPDAFTVRLAEITGFEKSRRLVALPQAPTELLGLAGIRGRLVPVYSLPLILGCAPAGEHPWWLIVGGDEPIGLGVSAFLGHWRISPGEISKRAAQQVEREHVTEFVRIADSMCGILDLPAIGAAIRERASAKQLTKEIES